MNFEGSNIIRDVVGLVLDHFILNGPSACVRRVAKTTTLLGCGLGQRLQDHAAEHDGAAINQCGVKGLHDEAGQLVRLHARRFAQFRDRDGGAGRPINGHGQPVRNIDHQRPLRWTKPQSTTARMRPSRDSADRVRKMSAIGGRPDMRRALRKSDANDPKRKSSRGLASNAHATAARERPSRNAVGAFSNRGKTASWTYRVRLVPGMAGREGRPGTCCLVTCCHSLSWSFLLGTMLEIELVAVDFGFVELHRVEATDNQEKERSEDQAAQRSPLP